MKRRTTHSTATDRAVGFLRNLVSEYVRDKRDRLPTVKQLAAMAQVSTVAIVAAVRTLKFEGVVEARRGRWISVAVRGPQQALEPPVPRQSKAHRLRRIIEADLLSGHFPADTPLPSHKELARRYGVCYRTLKAALRELVTEGALIPYKRTYRTVLGKAGPAHRPTVVLVARGDPSGNLVRVTFRTHDYLRALENECARLGVNLTVAACGHDVNPRSGVSRGGTSLARHARDQRVMGFVVWTIGLSGVIGDLLDVMARCGKPIAFLDEYGDGQVQALAAGKKLTQVFSVSVSPATGVQMGNYLLGLGHRKAVYVSPYHGGRWSRNRFAGLRKAFSAFGLGDAVVPVTTGEGGRIDALDFVNDARRLALSAQMLLTLSPAQTERALTTLEREGSRLRRRLRELAGTSSLRRRVIVPLVERALEHRDATVWVAANDGVALECLELLKRHHVRVPRDLSLVGFDDTVEAFFQKVTSLNYNAPALMRSMVEHVLAPNRLPHRRNATIETEAIIVERGTATRLSNAAPAPFPASRDQATFPPGAPSPQS